MLLGWLGEVGAPPLGYHMGPKPFTEEAAPKLLAQDWPGRLVGNRASRAGGPGQPALHAPGLPASSYSGSQAGSLRELSFGQRKYDGILPLNCAALGLRNVRMRNGTAPACQLEAMSG